MFRFFHGTFSMNRIDLRSFWVTICTRGPGLGSWKRTFIIIGIFFSLLYKCSPIFIKPYRKLLSWKILLPINSSDLKQKFLTAYQMLRCSWLPWPCDIIICLEGWNGKQGYQKAVAEGITSEWLHKATDEIALLFKVFSLQGQCMSDIGSRCCVLF